MRALLVNPWIHDFTAYDYWLKPLGLLIISSFLKKHAWKVDVIDLLDRHHSELESSTTDRDWGTGKFISEPLPKPAVLRSIPRKYRRYGLPPPIFRKILSSLVRPDVILVTSMMTYWYPGVIETISSLREAFPGVKIVLGGVYARLLPRHAEKHSGADIVFPGSDLADLAVLLNRLSGSDLPQDPCGDAGCWPDPDYSVYARLPYACIVTSSGCPFRCSYCSSPVLTPEFRPRRPTDVADLVLFLSRTRGVRDFAFYDDALLFDGEARLFPVLRKLNEEVPGLRFHTPNGLHARFIDPPTADLLKSSGFTSLRLSLETSDENSQSRTGGKVTNCEFERSVDALRGAGFARDEIRTYVIAGLPGQDAESVRETIRFVRRSGATAVIAEYSMIPGTADWELNREALGLDALDPLLHNNTIFAPLMGWLSLEDLERLKKEARS